MWFGAGSSVVLNGLVSDLGNTVYLLGGRALYAAKRAGRNRLYVSSTL